MREDVETGRTSAAPEATGEETQSLLRGLRRALSETRADGGTALKLDPDELRNLCSRAGVEGDAVAAFRLLVRSNLVRLRGRWREGVSGETAPVYVSRVIGGRGDGEPVSTGSPNGNGTRGYFLREEAEDE